MEGLAWKAWRGRPGVEGLAWKAWCTPTSPHTVVRDGDAVGGRVPGVSHKLPQHPHGVPQPAIPRQLLTPALQDKVHCRKREG